ncbi:hypothetical protein D5S18_00785 [Nocardia panacis]|uniref:Uncharacterized protein n=2 Tax=Nocardia panacis TaxID=2340916 RepID=A0A3A4KQ66_9NOCA|nr:hypothetical protein D5S18_00785 [Nocardia panacis]
MGAVVSTGGLAFPAAAGFDPVSGFLARTVLGTAGAAMLDHTAEGALTLTPASAAVVEAGITYAAADAASAAAVTATAPRSV